MLKWEIQGDGINLFGTIIMDSYKLDEVEKMAQFIDEICSPMDSCGWSSAGIYSFWDYYTKEVLYIGLASDLCVRFKQHNGLIHIKDSACKYKQIKEYFSKNERIGYSILVQSSMAQPIVHRNESTYRNIFKLSKKEPIPNYASEEGIEFIKQAEGQLIESYKKVKGTIPQWNKIGGDIFSRKYASQDNFQYIIQAFSNVMENNILVSKATIRELAENSIYEWFEIQLHGVRVLMISLHISFVEAIDIQINNNPLFKNEWQKIVDSKYLKRLPIP